jgi:hypothetical protein
MPSPNDRTTRAAFWQQHVLQWKATQLTQIAYCKEHELNFHRFNYWLRKNNPVKAKKDPVSQSSAFVPVVKHPVMLTGLCLNFPNAMILQGIDVDNLATVKQLMHVLS